jgi:hypothetical protein
MLLVGAIQHSKYLISGNMSGWMVNGRVKCHLGAMLHEMEDNLLMFGFFDSH